MVNYYKTHARCKQLVDQTLHLLGAMLILAPSVWGQFWASALLIGAGRELEQIRAKGVGWSWHWRRTLDVAFWVVGGVVLQVAVWVSR